ncbi:DUF2380 domain-containing protein [Archangium violaceum]|uniref:DUF2380 domain-containing protein n=1 Tax=Archangium violaceum Cb vi76 TaxID=1406225 RepID=A0A084SMK1_9BACT|nr:DUF2380 domain-containing protein [Archangium violaceum]KFA89686.1 hypothetical protein Q664_32860 [Archangium violaceum Cb vi76]
MRAESPGVRWTGLLLALALLSNACAPLMPPPGRGTHLRYTPHEAATPAWAQGPGEASTPEPEGPQRLHRRQGTREAVTAVGPRGEETPWGSALAAHLAFRAALLDVSGSTRGLSGELSRLRKSHWGIAGKAGLFVPHIEYGQDQLRWLDAEFAAATRLAHAATEVEDPDMQRALLRLAGPRLEAALLGSLLLAAWVDVLHLLDVAFKQGYNSLETLFVDMDRWRQMVEPAMTALASREPGQVEAAAENMPALMGYLSGELNRTAQRLESGLRNVEKVKVLAQLMELVTMRSALKFSLPTLRPPAPVTLGVGMVMGTSGVMMGTRIVVSAEWVEMMQRLVREGVLSLPAISAAVRIQAGQMMMAHGELPRGVREALGDGPEVRGMRVTDRAGAGMAERPRHHVMPQEFREWFEKRGFTGDMDINKFCVRLEQAHHQAIHGGGNWKLGRLWPGEWNRMIMKTLRDAEIEAGRMLTRNEVLDIVGEAMKRYGVPMKFVPWRGS